MALSKLREFLDSHNIKYVTISHSPAYTAQGVAAAVHVSGRELAKTVMVWIEGRLAMVVLPASARVNFALLKEVVGSDQIELAHEQEFRDMFTDCDLGAMPPFGNLYGLDVYISERLADQDEIAFNACTHTEIVKMSFEDYERLVRPKILRLSYQ